LSYFRVSDSLIELFPAADLLEQLGTFLFDGLDYLLIASISFISLKFQFDFPISIYFQQALG
jgi:hypothetical protein